MTYSMSFNFCYPLGQISLKKHTFTVNEQFNLDKYIISRSEPERTF